MFLDESAKPSLIHLIIVSDSNSKYPPKMYMPVIIVCWNLRQEDGISKATLSYRVRPYFK